MFSSIPHLENLHEAFFMDPELGYFMKNKLSRYNGACIWPSGNLYKWKLRMHRQFKQAKNAFENVSKPLI